MGKWPPVFTDMAVSVSRKTCIALVLVLVPGILYFSVSYKGRDSNPISIRHNYHNASVAAFRRQPYFTRVSGTVNCQKLFDGDKLEAKRASQIQYFNFAPQSTLDLYRKFTENCDIFKTLRRYITVSLTPEEDEFPLAYSILSFTSAEQTERLLRAIYRPQNVYCLHVDARSESEYRALEAVAACFDNVFMASRRLEVDWNGITSLEADMVCMRDLFYANKTWKYFINLTGQEYPLKTNLEIVRILTLYNGANDVEGISKRLNYERFDHAGPVPGGLTLFKGSNHVILSRAAVDFILHDNMAARLLEWHKMVFHPGESFFSILNHNPQAGMPGAFTGKIRDTYVPPVQHADGLPVMTDGKPFLARYKLWSDESTFRCHGKYVRALCVFGHGDLPMIAKRKELFINKLYQDFQPMTYQCLEEFIFNRTRDQFLHLEQVNLTFYQNLDFYKQALH